ncbi:Gfo/Idh/MocA family protein [Nocardioides sp. L-11A]|uniref:Gfo/Idh/MocA family protein n=1 Tax=Nocardioides sp. L-11A TaxID=3043848 RepID=UPI00249CE40F|nr:Gfo/Idh/MocA family oxidoreductase [Nocardioides sp. L-11A]
MAPASGGPAPVGVAVVGLGFMGTRWVRALADHDGARVVAVCDVDGERARKVADTCGARWATGLEALADPRVDAVVVCTPDHLHRDAALEAIRAGLPVAVEKPFAHDIATAAEIRDAAAAAGVPVLAGHLLRFEPRYAAAQAAVADGQIGRVLAIRSERIGLLGDQKVLGGRVSVPLYYGTHEMDIARWFAGDIAEVDAVSSGGVLRSQGFDVDDLYSVRLSFASGAHGTSMLGWVLPDASLGAGLTGLSVIGEHGYLTIVQGGTGLSVHGAAGPVPVDSWYAPTMHGRTSGAIGYQARHLVEVARGEREPLCSAADGTEAVRAALAIERSAQRGTRIRLEETAP